MLIGIDPLLGPELLAHLRAMGHGDELVIADANFPAASVARRLVRAEGAAAPQMLAAVLALLPLDTFVDCAVCVMEVVGSAGQCAPIVDEFREIVAARSGPTFANIAAVERFAFTNAHARRMWWWRQASGALTGTSFFERASSCPEGFAFRRARFADLRLKTC